MKRSLTINKKATVFLVEVFDFQEGLARVEVSDKWGYIGKKGKFVWVPKD